MMNQNDGWMHGWMSDGMGTWSVIGILLLLVVVLAVIKLSRR